MSVLSAPHPSRLCSLAGTQNLRRSAQSLGGADANPRPTQMLRLADSQLPEQFQEQDAGAAASSTSVRQAAVGSAQRRGRGNISRTAGPGRGPHSATGRAARAPRHAAVPLSADSGTVPFLVGHLRHAEVVKRAKDFAADSILPKALRESNLTHWVEHSGWLKTHDWRLMGGLLGKVNGSHHAYNILLCRCITPNSKCAS